MNTARVESSGRYSLSAARAPKRRIHTFEKRRCSSAIVTWLRPWQTKSIKPNSQLSGCTLILSTCEHATPESTSIYSICRRSSRSLCWRGNRVPCLHADGWPSAKVLHTYNSSCTNIVQILQWLTGRAGNSTARQTWMLSKPKSQRLATIHGGVTTSLHICRWKKLRMWKVVCVKGYAATSVP